MRPLLVGLSILAVPSLLAQAPPTATPAPSTTDPAATTKVEAPVPSAPAAPAPTPMDSVSWTKAVMVEKGGQHSLSPIAGAFASTYAFVTVLFYADFPDTSAQLHISDPMPTFYVRSDLDPRGRIFLVKTKQSRQGRSVKLGKSSFGGVSGVMVPDSDWTVEFAFKETAKEGVWSITPKAPLPKGGYGLYMGVLGNLSASAPGGGGSLFDFAVD